MSLGVGVIVVDRYEKLHILATGYAIICVLLAISGLITMTTGIMLHSIRGLLLELLSDRKKL